jgi:catechol 2,3-dioxygenase-like lactoylglutathione lyase family enzyme
MRMAGRVRLYRVIVPVSDIDRAVTFYSRVLEMPGERVSPGRHYFECGGTILACFDPRADGDGFDARPNPDHIYLAVGDLEMCYERARAASSTRRSSPIPGANGASTPSTLAATPSASWTRRPCSRAPGDRADEPKPAAIEGQRKSCQ